MTMFDVKFDLDELKVFQSAMTETPTARIVTSLINNIFRECKARLMVPTHSLEDMRVDQGSIRALATLDEQLGAILALDPNDIEIEEVENNETEEESNAVDVRF